MKWPEEGLNGQGHMDKLRTAAVVIDSISWNIKNLAEGVKMMARVKNGPRNKVVNFDASLNALVTPKGLESSFLFIDGKGNKTAHALEQARSPQNSSTRQAHSCATADMNMAQ